MVGPLLPNTIPTLAVNARQSGWCKKTVLFTPVKIPTIHGIALNKPVV